MRKAERARLIARRLQELYPDPPIPLAHRDAYTLLIAVLLSAQCTDARVNLVTPALFARAADPQAMVELGEAGVLELIRSCGLAPGKARAIVALSRILLTEHGGQVPKSFAALERLPGVGHKTASVVMCQAFDEPAFPVDTHIHRLAQRWGLSDGSSVARTERDLKKLFPQESWRDLHLQMIYYGREHCSARGCDGTRCEICRTCYPRRKTALQVRRA
jgi:endonuclease-3